MDTQENKTSEVYQRCGAFHLRGDSVRVGSIGRRSSISSFARAGIITSFQCGPWTSVVMHGGVLVQQRVLTFESVHAGLSILANDAAAAAVGIETVSGRRKRGGSADK